MQSRGFQQELRTGYNPASSQSHVNFIQMLAAEERITERIENSLLVKRQLRFQLPSDNRSQMLYLCRGALSSEARFIVSLGMVWFGDRVVYPGLPSEDRAAKHMGKLLQAQLMASAETPKPTLSCLQSQAGDNFLLQRRRGAPQEPKIPSSHSQERERQTSFVSHFLSHPNPGTEQKGVKEQDSTPQQSEIRDSQVSSHRGAPDIHSLMGTKSLSWL